MCLCERATCDSAETGFVTLKYAGAICHPFKAVHLKSVEMCFLPDLHVSAADTAVHVA